MTQMMEKFFNTAGPGIPEDHYMVDPLRRVNYEEIATLVDQKRFFFNHFNLTSFRP